MALAISLLLSFPSFALETSDASPVPNNVDTSIQTAALPPARSVVLERQRLETLNELRAISSDVGVTQDVLASLDAEIATLRGDRDAIRDAMIEAALRQKEASAKLTELEVRIGALSAEEGDLKASLVERRVLLAEVLGALQRMGRKPPPALLVKPEDALGSVRSAILLGSVVPGLRDETRILLADLKRLETVRTELAADMDSFGNELGDHRREEERLKRLSAEKAELEEQNVKRRSAAKRRAEELAGRAEDLEGLIEAIEEDVKTARMVEKAEREAAEKARIEQARLFRERELAAAKAAAKKAERLIAEAAAKEATEIAAAAKAEDETKRAAELAAKADRVRSPDADPSIETARTATPASGDFKDTAEPRVTAKVPEAASEEGDKEDQIEVAMLEPAASNSAGSTNSEAYDIEALRRSVRFLEPSAPFSTLKRSLNRPVAGERLIGFGERDDIGREVTGVSYSSRSGDVVTAPADAKVLYSGPFRSYGEVLILDAGDGYHIVLAGMDRIEAETGQFVSAGEPIAAMGSRRIASANATDFGTEGPALYVEFRRNGRPVDPSAWWAD